MKDTSNKNSRTDSSNYDVPEMELNDGDILDAMQHISGYLDITTEDFRMIYQLAHRHAVGRILGNLKAENFMRVNIEPLLPDITLEEAAKVFVQSGYMSLPVVNEMGCVIGILTETDFMRRLKVNSIMELLLNMMDDAFEFKHNFHETHVRETMFSPVITITKDAGFKEVIRAFYQHEGRSMPVVSGDGRLLGMLLRKDFLTAYNLEVIR